MTSPGSGVSIYAGLYQLIETNAISVRSGYGGLYMDTSDNLFFQSDSGPVQITNGTCLNSSGVSGTGAANQVTIWSGTSTIKGETGLTFETGTLSVGTGVSIGGLTLQDTTITSATGLSIKSEGGNLSLTASGGNVIIQYLTWPNSDGLANQVLSTNGTSVLSWADNTSGVSQLGEFDQVKVESGSDFNSSLLIVPTGTASSSATGDNNTGIGTCVFFSMTTGTSNTVLGANAGNAIVDGEYLTLIGQNAGSTATTASNVTCLGFNAQPTGPGSTNQIILGDSNITDLICADTTIASLSDARDKKDVIDSPYGLDFIDTLRPVQFTWNRRVLEESDVDHSKNGKRRIGFLAQDLLQSATDEGNEILDLVHRGNPERWEAKYGNLLPVMVKAIKDLKGEVDVLRERIQQLEK